MKKNLSLILLILGLLPFVLVLAGGIYAAITGFSGVAISDVYYGLDAFMEWVILWSFLYWPSYIIGIGFIVMGFIIRRR